MTDFHEYTEMIDSAKNKGFNTNDIEFLYFDNIGNNTFDGFNGINRAIREAKGEYLVFCHQDILFEFDNREKLDKCMLELESLDSNWSVAGNAGKNHMGDSKVRITDPNWENLSLGKFPERVMGVDENFIIINRKHSFGCSTNMSGFHLYGIDLCQNAASLGLNTYVVDFHLRHKSGGNLSKEFFESALKYRELQIKRKIPQIVWTICTRFYVSNNRVLNWLYSYDYFLDKKNKKLKKKNKE